MSNAPATAHATLTNAVGLHARPSVKLTQLAKTFEATVEVALSADGPFVNAKSPVAIMRVKAAKGAVLYFRAEGRDSKVAVNALVSLIERRFEEEDTVQGSGA